MPNRFAVWGKEYSRITQHFCAGQLGKFLLIGKVGEEKVDRGSKSRVWLETL